MKTKISLLLLFIISLLIFSGCQKEAEEIIDPPSDEVFTPESTVANLIQRTALRDGSFDNIIDGSSCTSLILPITVIVNGLEIILDSQDDFYTVEHILDKFDDDDDIIDIFFPVTVILADHSELILTDEHDLEDLIDQCTEDGDDDDIECVDFKFPLTISIYDSENQLSDVITIDEDKELHKFIHDLDENDFASFNFPISLVLSDGAEMVINDNEELEDILENAIGACDEDDDNDHDEDDADDTELVHVLIDGHWAISYFFDDIDKTAEFAGYVFTFFGNGTAKAINGNLVIEGLWYSNGDDGTLEIQLDFGENSPLDELQDDWHIIEFDGMIIKLKDTSGGDNSIEYLTFERPSEHGGTNPPAISDVIVEGLWIVANYDDSGEDETADYNDIKLNFLTNGTVEATKGDDMIEGSWSITMHEGMEKLVLDFGEHVPLDEFNDDWDIVDVKEMRIELKDVSGGDGSIDKLVLERF